MASLCHQSSCNSDKNGKFNYPTNTENISHGRKDESYLEIAYRLSFIVFLDTNYKHGLQDNHHL